MNKMSHQGEWHFFNKKSLTMCLFLLDLENTMQLNMPDNVATTSVHFNPHTMWKKITNHYIPIFFKCNCLFLLKKNYQKQELRENVIKGLYFILFSFLLRLLAKVIYKKRICVNVLILENWVYSVIHLWSKLIFIY